MPPAYSAEKYPLREVAAGQFDFTVLRLIGIAGQRVEAFPIFGSGAEQSRIRVEPAQQPGVDVRRAETPEDYFATFDFSPFFKK
jgi:hypothetical protein